MFPIDADVRQCRQAGWGINTATNLRRPEAMENLRRKKTLEPQEATSAEA